MGDHEGLERQCGKGLGHEGKPVQGVKQPLHRLG